MSLPRRISAGGIVFRDKTVLLVRYRDVDKDETYLVAPGGAVEDDENVVQAIIREVKEETDLCVKPTRVIAIEDMVDLRVKMIKVWMLCEIVAGDVYRTDGAINENIIEVAWFTRAQLADELVFPPFLIQYDWAQFQVETWQVLCLPSRTARFSL
ncbi:NUDIX hydrolase [bacterium]|nr:NUDIX hydrolase [bacterium]